MAHVGPACFTLAGPADSCNRQVLDIAVRGAFINCGQNCVAAERFYVQEGVYDQFVSAGGVLRALYRS